MTSWSDFAAAEPDLAAAGRALFYQHGVGLAFMATTRADGGPRLHPMCPVMTADSIYAFIVPSPKQADLLRDGRYALHSFPRPDNEDAFMISGPALIVDDAVIRQDVSDQFVAERAAFGVAAPGTTDRLFEFAVERCLFTRTAGHGDPNPVHTVWPART